MIPRILLIVGAVLIGVGCWLSLSDSPNAENRRTASLPVMQPKAAFDLPPNTALLLEGKLVAREALGPEGFVVYEKEQFLRTETEGANRGKEQWQALSVPRPLIGVELDGARVSVCNRDYTLSNPLQRWQSDVLPTSRDLFHSTVRLRGFKALDPLTIDGRVVGLASNGTQCIEAKTIFGGSPQFYRESVRPGIIAFKVVGAIFGALGTLMVVTGWRLRRRRSPSRR